MYVQIDQFAIDKAMATVIEEAGIAKAYICEYYRRQEKRIQRVEKNLGNYNQQDLIDTLGVKWEVKVDRLAPLTGNFYLELQTFEKNDSRQVSGIRRREGLRR